MGRHHKRRRNEEKSNGGKEERKSNSYATLLLGLITALSLRRYKQLALLFALAYAIGYMFTTGIFQVLPYPVPELVLPKVPGSLFYIDGPIGQFPLLQFFFTRTFMFSISLSAAVFIAIQAPLVGLVLSMLVYNLKISKCNCKESYGIAAYGLGQGVFSVFACCGGGLLLLIIGSAGFAALRSFSLLIPIVSIVALFLSLILMSKRISKTTTAYSNRTV